jgi:hypothetical protein
MASSSPAAGAPPSLASRLLYFSAGLLALGIGTIITLGAALAGAAAIGIAGYLKGRKKAPFTRRAAWFAAVAGTFGVLAVLTGDAILTNEAATRPITAAERAEQRATAMEAMPEWLRTMNPGAQRQSAVADSMAAQLLENRAVVIWAGLMGAVVASAMLGTIAGSFAWGGVMLLYRGYRGEWLPQRASEPSGL